MINSDILQCLIIPFDLLHYAGDDTEISEVDEMRGVDQKKGDQVETLVIIQWPFYPY
jgi:hypothetical protein